MSQSFYWRQLSSGKALPVNAPSSFREAMSEVFGEPPWLLDTASISRLLGLRAGLKHERDAIDEILEAIEKHNEVEIDVR